jgi:hypothetical protein
MPIEIRRVENERQLRKFIKFQYSIQPRFPNWVPSLFIDELNTLSKKRNAAFEFCEAEYWMAYKDGKLAGRIAALVNHRYIEKWGKKAGRFGWFECIEDFEVAEALLKTAEDWARSKGLEYMNGPLGFTDMDKEGLLIEGYDELGTMPMIYNPPYYPEFIERLGYKKDVDWLEFEVHVPSEIPEKAIRVQELVQKRSGLRIAEWKSPKDLKKRYAKAVFELVDKAYGHLYGTTPLSDRQKDAYVSQYLGFVDPRFTKIIVDKNDKLVAFGIALPSLSRAIQKGGGRLFPFGWYHILHALKHPVSLDMYLIAMDPEESSLGAVALLMTSIITSCKEAGIKTAETAGELETNHQVQSLWRDYEKRQHKRRRAYIKQL